MSVRALALGILLALVGPAGAAAPPDYEAMARGARELLDRLVAADTTNPPGNEARAVALGVERLKAANIPYEVTEFAPGRENLVARLKGDGSARPLLVLAHTDVVGTTGQAWATDPHRMTERDGFLVGRGVHDDLAMAAIGLEVLLALARSGTPLRRDVILAWTGDEESGGGGIRWLLANRPDSVAAEIALNEGGGPRLGPEGRVRHISLQTAEKTYQDFVLTAHGPTGHASLPVPGNAIYRLAAALDRVGRHRFPPHLVPVTRAYLEARAKDETGELGAALRRIVAAPGAPPADAVAVAEQVPELNAALRTTCVATLLSGGTRVNALPAEATATLNCRVMPDERIEDVQRILGEVVADKDVEIRPTSEFGWGTPSTLEGPGPAATRKVATALWPDVTIVPSMSSGATDSRFLRAKGVSAYGLSPIPISEDDVRRSHGIDERIPVSGLRPGVEFLYKLVVELAAAGG